MDLYFGEEFKVQVHGFWVVASRLAGWNRESEIGNRIRATAWMECDNESNPVHKYLASPTPQALLRGSDAGKPSLWSYLFDAFVEHPSVPWRRVVGVEKKKRCQESNQPLGWPTANKEDSSH